MTKSSKRKLIIALSTGAGLGIILPVTNIIVIFIVVATLLFIGSVFISVLLFGLISGWDLARIGLEGTLGTVIVLVLMFSVGIPVYSLRYEYHMDKRNAVISEIEKYKLRHGKYPESLRDMPVKDANEYIYQTYEGYSRFRIESQDDASLFTDLYYDSESKEWKEYGGL